MALSGEGAVEEGDHLGAVADGVGAEGGGGQTGGDAVFHRPEDGPFIPGTLCHVGEGTAVRADGGLAHGPVQEGDHLRPVAVGGGAEMGGIHTGGDAVFHRPEDRLIVEVRGLDIHKGIDSGAGFGLAYGAPEEGDHMGAHAGAVGVEGGGGGAAGDAVFHRPEDGIIEEAALGDIGEGVAPDLAAAEAGIALPVVVQGRHGPGLDLAAAGAFALLPALGGAALFSSLLSIVRRFSTIVLSCIFAC